MFEVHISFGRRCCFVWLVCMCVSVDSGGGGGLCISRLLLYSSS